MITTEQVITRLKQLGIEVAESKRNVVEYELELILNYVINYCNLKDIFSIPTILDKRIIDQVCCEYLKKQKNAGNLENFNYDVFIKSIKEGDTQIQYGNTSDAETPESRFDALLNYMERGFDKWISVHRRIRW